VTTPRTEPQRLGPYRLVERIGEGGMGVVHLAVTPSGDLVAVKALRPWLVGGHDGRQRFAREVATLQRVRSRRVAEVLDADVSGDPPYIVTRYVRGPSLDKVIGDHGPLRGAALRRLASGLADALAQVHMAGIVHRDVKPGNVLMTDDGPVLIDFGLAWATDQTRLTATGLVMGTPGYLAPEVVAGRESSTATDVHGWAGTVVFAATGRPPYGTGPDSVVLDRIRRGEYDLAGVEPGLASVLRCALATDPAQRPSVAEISQRVGQPDGGATAVVEPVPPTAVVPTAGPPTRVDQDPPQVEPVRPRPAAVPPRPPVSPRPAAPPPAAGPTAPPGGGLAPPAQTWPARLAVGAGWLALLLLVAAAPRAGLAAVFALMVVARTTWRVRRGLHERRLARGYQPSDSWVMVAGSPWHVAVSALQSAIHLLWVGLAGFVVGAAAALIDELGPRAPYLAGAAMVVLLTWLGPGTSQVRSGIRVITRPLNRNPQVGWVLFGALLAVSWVVLLIWDSYGTGWPPLNDLPNPLDLVQTWFGG
jgi:hypothetical protein